MTLATFLKYKGKEPLGGVIAAGTWTPLAKKYWNTDITTLSDTPMLRLQGGDDRVIYPENAEEDNKNVYFGYIYKGKENYLHYENDPKVGHSIKQFD
jgi:predicted esterase